jgi:hypothetical protein
MTSIPIVISVSGDARMVFDDRFDASGVGKVTIKRVSHVEPTTDGRWSADLSPVNGPILGPFEKRKDALDAEVTWLHENWLTANSR